MGSLATGEVVLMPFPFSDLSQTKIRPAVYVADAGRGDFILCQITSQPYGDAMAIVLDDSDFVTGGLRLGSYVRPSKVFTVDQRLVQSSAGTLNPTTIQRI